MSFAVPKTPTQSRAQVSRDKLSPHSDRNQPRVGLLLGVNGFAVNATPPLRRTAMFSVIAFCVTFRSVAARAALMRETELF